jgi:predicted transcriptional regulator of viral defense system
MASPRSKTRSENIWRLASEQHGLVALDQLLERQYTISAIKHRIATGRLHPVRAGVYAVGRPDLGGEGEWMAAVLSCGPDAALSHGSAAALWGLAPERENRIHVTVPSARDRRQPGITLHRRSTLAADEFAMHRGIPLTAPTRTLMDLATLLPGPGLGGGGERGRQAGPR